MLCCYVIISVNVICIRDIIKKTSRIWKTPLFSLFSLTSKIIWLYILVVLMCILVIWSESGSTKVCSEIWLYILVILMCILVIWSESGSTKVCSEIWLYILVILMCILVIWSESGSTKVCSEIWSGLLVKLFDYISVFNLTRTRSIWPRSKSRKFDPFSCQNYLTRNRLGSRVNYLTMYPSHFDQSPDQQEFAVTFDPDC
jgi:hypothetical protein